MHELYSTLKPEFDARQDIRQSLGYANYMQSQGWEARTFDATNQYIYLKRWPIIGSVAKLMRPRFPIDTGRLMDLLREQRVLTTRIEPYSISQNTVSELNYFGFHIDKSPLRPTKTRRISLILNEQGLLESFDRARSWIRKIDQQSVHVTYDHFSEFFSVWEQAATLQHIWHSTRKDFENLVNCFRNSCFAITINDSCGCLVLMHEGTAYYYYAAALPAAKEQNLPYLVVWEAMKYAKQLGCRLWDFESIFDTRWNMYPKWKGFSQFKATFAGEEIEYPLCLIRHHLSALLGH